MAAVRAAAVWLGTMFATAACQMRNSRPRIRSARTCATFAIMWGLVTAAVAAELQSRTVHAYDHYVEQARRVFVARAKGGDLPAAERHVPETAHEIDTPSPEGRMLRVPGGVVHHWRGATFIPGVDLDDVLATAQAYENYAAVYEAVLQSKLIGRHGDAYRVFARVKEDAGILSAVLDVWSAVTYHRSGDQAYSVSEAQEIRQLENPDRPDERHLPQGRDSGYLWRANTFTRFLSTNGGVYVELETIGLSRGFSRILAWMIEPIARRVGRSSVERTLKEFRGAVQAQAQVGRPPQVSQDDRGALRVFEERIGAYMALRRRVEEPLPPLRPTTDMGSFEVRRSTLASAIKAARPDARRGDILTPVVTAHLRRAMAEALHGVDVEALLLDLYAEDDVPGGYRPQVHHSFPEWATRAVPAILLLRLPPLPAGIEYRLIGHDLVLLDVGADLIIDVLPGAIPRARPSVLQVTRHTGSTRCTGFRGTATMPRSSGQDTRSALVDGANTDLSAGGRDFSRPREKLRSAVCTTASTSPTLVADKRHT